VAFVGGILYASGRNWTPLSFAQGRPSASDIRPLADASNAFVAIADHVTPAVVSIQVDIKTKATSRRLNIPQGMLPPGMEDFFNNGVPAQPMVQEASGSGFLVSKDGYILTNNHVVTGSDRSTVADKITVQLLDHRRFTARVVGNDPSTDIAVIKIDGDNFPTLSLGNDANTRVGEWVLAIGNPLGLDFTVTAGIVSAKGRSLPGLLSDRYAISDLIQTDAAINPGNSGGPLVNSRGEVIGVNSAIASQTGYYSGYGFAIPITLAKRVMDDIIAHGKVRYGVLGVGIDEVSSADAAVAGLKEIRGAKVQSFTPDNNANPARAAGLQPGDVITAVDGQQVDRVNSLQRIIRGHKPGESVTLDVMRYGEHKQFTIKLMERPSDTNVAEASSSSNSATPSSSKLGVTLAPLPAQRPSGFPSHGVVVADVDQLGPSANSLLPNDIITDILYPSPRRPVNSVADLQQALSGIKNGGYISLSVFASSRSGNITRVVNIQVGEH
jgi:serine protease Do